MRENKSNLTPLTFIKGFVALVLICSAQFSDAAVDFMAEALEKIKVVNVAPAVQEQLNKATPEDRENLEASIYKGNEFIPLHFSEKAYDTTPANAEWAEETAPLVAFDRKEWERRYELLEIRRKKTQIDNVNAFTTRLVCPQVSLVGVEYGKTTTSLIYRTTNVGTLFYYRGDLYDFNVEGSGNLYDMRIDVDYRFLISAFIPSDKWATLSFTWPVGLMKEFLADHRTAVFTTKEHENEKIKVYRKTIKKIEESAAQICK